MPGAFYRQDIQVYTISVSVAGEQTPFVNVLVAVDMHQTRQLIPRWHSAAERERIIRALRSFSMITTPFIKFNNFNSTFRTAQIKVV